MCMATKTITIMDDAYQLLADNKLENESFSEEIRRIFSQQNKKKLKDFFGILSKEAGKELISNYEKIKQEQLKLTKKRIQEL